MAVPKSEERVVEILVNGAKANASLKEMSAAAAVLSNQVAKIAADDPKRAELIAQLQVMKQRIADARAEIGGLLTAEQQLTATQQQLTAAQAATVAEQVRAIEAGKANTASLGEMKVAAGLLEKQLVEMASDAPGRAALITDFQTLKGRMVEARSTMEGVIKTEAQLRAEQEALHASEEALRQAEAGRVAEQKQAIAAGKQQTASFAEMKTAAGLLEKQLHELASDDPNRKTLLADYQALKVCLEGVQREMANVGKSDVELVVNGKKVAASMGEMKQAAAALERQLESMAGDDPGRKKLITDLQSMKTRIGQVQQEVKGVSETTGVMKQAFANAFAIFTGGGILGVVQQLFGFFSASREQALDAAKSSADLDATLKSTAHSAGLTADEIRRIGTERAKVTLFDDDDTNRASAMLLTFTNIKKGVFEQAMPAIQDLATKMGGDGPADMKGAAIQVGKALNDPVNGLKALTRVGVTFNEQQKEQIKTMVKAGDTAGAQKLILAELNKEFGGSAEAARRAAGGVATLSMWFNEFKETVGGKVNGVLGTLSQWLGRVLDKSQPLVDMVTELVDQFAAYYHEIGDVLEGLGLFNDKTDTAALFVEALKTALTVLLIPLRVGLQVAKAVVDTFVDWYNKSELLRGVLGGLGATVVSLFTTIKDDAIKILGGVGDILIGIFTLDKAKIAAGFKSALSATADLALEAGNKAADAFAKGYEANKHNHITRTKPRAEGEQAPDKVGTSAKQEAAGESEADRKKREAAAKKAEAEALKRRLAEIEAEQHHQQMLLNLRQAAVIARQSERDAELQGVYFDAQRKLVALEAAAQKEIAQLTGSEQEKKKRTLAIQQELEAQKQLLTAEYHQKQGELVEKFNQADLKVQEEFIDQQLEAIEDDAQRKQAAFDAMLGAGLSSQRAADEAKYAARQAAFRKELALIEASLGKESSAYKKVFGAMVKDQDDQSKKAVAIREQELKQKKQLQNMEMSTAGDVLSFGLQLLDQDADARKKHHTLYTALAAAKIIIDGTKEVQQIWEYSAENPANGPTMGAAGIAMGAIQTAIAVARTAVALGQLRGGSGSGGGGSYWQGGATGDGGGLAVSPMGQLLQLTGMRVDTGGKLQDGSGFAVAGVVHEDEYVVPKWMRADPQVAAVEQWLEARRMRGFADGGPTSSGSSGAVLPVAAASPSTDGEKTYAVQTQMLAALLNMNSQLADVKQWQRELQVQLNLGATKTGLNVLAQAERNSGLRRSGA